MAAILGNGVDVFVSNLTLEGTPVKAGAFVEPNWIKGTASLPANQDAADNGDLYVVLNENDTVLEEVVDDFDYVVKEGVALKLKKMLPGELLITTEFEDALNKGDVVAPTADGKLGAIGETRTPKTTFTVKDKMTLWGVPVIYAIRNE